MAKSSKATGKAPTNATPKASTQQENSKTMDLQKNTADPTGQFMTTDQGIKINDDHNSLKAGDRGPTLLEDFILREKITHFDHERIPERIVHARGSGAHAGRGSGYHKAGRYPDHPGDPHLARHRLRGADRMVGRLA